MMDERMDVFVVFEDDGQAGFVPCNELLFYLNEEGERSGSSGSGSNFNGNGVIDVEAEAQLPDRPRLGDSGINRNDRRS